MADNAFLYDQPVDYFRHGCTTDGKFDPEKAKTLGYSEAQYPAIEQFLAGEDVGVPAPPQEEELEIEG